MKTASRIAFLLAAVTLSGCHLRPDGVLSDDKMADVIADMELAESYWNSKHSGFADTEERERFGKGVLAAHGVTVEELDSSLSWYGRNMDTYTELYEKVDKKLAARRKELMKGTADDIEIEEGNNLWPYGRHGMISSLGQSDGYVFSVSSDNLQKGDALEWKMNITPAVQSQGMLGVEYSDGSFSYTHRAFQGASKIEMRLQTDTAKHVERVFGTFRVSSPRDLPVMTDSMALIKSPLDTLQYYRLNGQGRWYGPPKQKRK